IRGVQAVMDVVLNRANAARKYIAIHGFNHHLFGDGSIKSACLARLQFSCWNLNDPNYPKIISLDWLNQQGAIDVMTLAADAIVGTVPDITDGALYYYAESMVKPPLWASKLQQVASVGGQLFYR
ncbi:cell wall hydrolase, partial [Patescibacteria group bacterium]|nr:cell wall hydrolase [Patescibacteria group bacterium]